MDGYKKGKCSFQFPHSQNDTSLNQSFTIYSMEVTKLITCILFQECEEICLAPSASFSVLIDFFKFYW